MDREAWRAAVHEVAKSQTWLSYWTELNWTEGGKKLFLDLLDLFVLAQNNPHAKVAHTGIAYSPPLSQKLPKLEGDIQRLRNCFSVLLSYTKMKPRPREKEKKNTSGKYLLKDSKDTQL